MNLQFKNNLEESGITADAVEKRFKFIHLDGAHTPFMFDKDCNVIDEKDGTYRQNTEAALTLAAMYIDELKKAEHLIIQL